MEIFYFVAFDCHKQQNKRLYWKAGKWIAKIPKPFATEILQHESKKLCKGKKNNPKFQLNFRATHF
jgi:hypothetical protein